MKKSVKFFTRDINKYLLATILFLGLAVALLPVYRLAMYATPYYDDYNYANSVRIMWNSSPTFGTVLKEAAWVVGNTYRSWQGTYSSVFLMSLMPEVFGTGYYFVGIFAIITALVAGTFFLTYTLALYVAKATRVNSVIVAELVTIAITELIYSAQQGIYWYNGSIHYTFAHGMLFVLIAFVIRFIYSDNKVLSWIDMAMVMILSAYVAGTNFITALQGLLAIGVIDIIFFFIKRRKALFLLIPLTLYVVGTIISIMAPGNSVRQQYYAGAAKSPIASVLLSFKSAGSYFPKFTGIVIIAVLLVLLPVMYDMAGKAKLSFRWPGLVSVFSFCLYATGFTPSWFGMGSDGLARTFCVVKITFLFLLFLNEFYWIGWIVKKRKEKAEGKEPVFLFKHCFATYLLSIAVLLISFVFSKDKAGSYLSYGAYYYIHTGEANNYYVEQMQRDEQIRKSGAVVELKPLVWRPWFLCKKEDLDSNPEAEQNLAAAKWYDKSAIYVVYDE